MNTEKENTLHSNEHGSLKKVRAGIVYLEDLEKIYNNDGSVKNNKIKIPVRIFEIPADSNIKKESKI